MPRDSRLYMTFPIDFWTHPKVSRLSDAAFRAFVEANGHSRMRESDGVLEADDAEFLWPVEALTELVGSHPSRPLLIRDGAGSYVLRDYAEHQFTKEDRDTLAEKRSRAGKASASKRRAGVEHVLNAHQQAATGLGIGIGKEVGNEGDGYVSSEVATATPRPEIDHLLNLLDTEIRRNGGTPSARNKRNTDATRLLLDKDGRTVDQVERAILWCQQDEFWRANILSMSKLREKYDQLRLAAVRNRPEQKAPKSRAAVNAAEYRRLFGESEGSIPAIDPGVG